MASFWNRLLGRQEATSADTARDRLKLVLVSDRSDISPEKLAQLQGEIIAVIKRYLDVDDAHVHIKLEQRARENYLVADIPLARDTSYGALPPVEAPPELEPEPEEPARATKSRKPRAASPAKPSASAPRKSRSRSTKAAVPDTDPPAEPPAP